jgi:hypothetical protein
VLLRYSIAFDYWYKTDLVLNPVLNIVTCLYGIRALGNVKISKYPPEIKRLVEEVVNGQQLTGSFFLGERSRFSQLLKHPAQ